MSNKNGLANFRIEVNALLKRRSRFVDPRSYNGFERNVFKQQRKNLENLKLVLKGIKKLNVVLTKKNFNEIFEKLNEAFKITIYEPKTGMKRIMQKMSDEDLPAVQF